MDQKIICFGETLWDILPTGRMPGGAPMNVAIHLRYNGFSPVLISRLGDDALGKDLLKVLKAKGIDISYIQADSKHPTSEVKANISNNREVSYEIPDAVSWDYIAYDQQAAQMVAQSNLFVYGSLAARNNVSSATLTKYLQLARVKVFDINLRPPYYTPKLIGQLMTYADIVKMNHYELIEIMSWFGKISPQQQAMEYIRQRFNLDMVLVSRGSQGAILLNDKGFLEDKGFQVEVADTIGSGDAFLAAFLGKISKGVDPEKALEFASATGACVATRSGALPEFSERQILEFIAQQKR
jgi:fructokinase